MGFDDRLGQQTAVTFDHDVLTFDMILRAGGYATEWSAPARSTLTQPSRPLYDRYRT
jgi:hypothetical protein